MARGKLSISLASGTALFAACLGSPPLLAENGDSATLVAAQGVSQASRTEAIELFSPVANRIKHRIDYQHWDEALAWLVIPMGPSIREGATRVEPGTGTRITYGHVSRYRLEGNRVAFSFVDRNILQGISGYRADLERIGTDLDLARLPRNEQLAYWLNLHNVAVVEALAKAYPLRDPSEGAFGSNETGLQDAKLVTVKGVELSPRDIRERIVYPNWNDPKVMYGFWRGEIGGPSIQRLAYTGDNLDPLLSLSAEEFVNSLRGVEAFNGALRVSRIYEEAEDFYFGSQSDLRDHLNQFARDDVKKLIRKNSRIAYNRYENDVADMFLGKADPGLQFVCSQSDSDRAGLVFATGSATLQCASQPTRPNRAVQRLMQERDQKLHKAYRRGIRTGMVIYGDGEYSESEAPKEIE